MQISSLALENRTLVLKLQQTKKDPSVVISRHNKGNDGELLFPEHGVTQISATGSEVGASYEMPYRLC